MVQKTNYKNKYLKYKLKYQKMINQKQLKGGMESSTQNIELMRIEQQLKENKEEAVKIKEEKTLLEAKEDYVEAGILLQKLIELKQIKENLEEQKKTLYSEASKLFVAPTLSLNTTQEFQSAIPEQQLVAPTLSRNTTQEYIPTYEELEQEKQKALEAIFSQLKWNIKHKIYNELFNIPKDISRYQLLVNYIEIIKVISPVEIIHICDSNNIYRQYCSLISPDFMSNETYSVVCRRKKSWYNKK